MTPGTIGDQELALLRFVADRGGTTVGEAVEGFGDPRQLARSTVLTMMERLRRKGHLARKSVDGVYRYQARVSSAELLRGVVRRFVEGNLGGSLAPFVAYLSESTDVTADELRQLEQAIARLQSRTTKETQR
jgi:Predicted transcriptional regulator